MSWWRRPSTWILFKNPKTVKSANPFLDAVRSLPIVDGIRKYWWSHPRTIEYQHKGGGISHIHIDHTALILDGYLNVEGLSVVSYERKNRGSLYHYLKHIAHQKYSSDWGDPYPIDTYFGLPRTIRVEET